MTRRILASTIVIIAIAVALFAIPLAITVRNLTIADELGELEHAATRAERTVGRDSLAGGDPTEFPSRSGGLHIALYDRNGTRRGGEGPSHLDAALTGVYKGQVINHKGASLAVAIPVTVNEHVVGAVRASASGNETAARVRRAWLLIAASGAVAIALGGLLAWWQARRLAAPLGDLAQAAHRVGDGDFTNTAPRSGVAEIDEVATALDATAGRLGASLQRERAFSADASHQLRTPLSALRVNLERALLADTVDRTTAEDALGEVERLDDTIDDLLALARDTHAAAEPLDVGALFDEVDREWHGPLAAGGRPLRIEREADLPAIGVSSAAMRQILAVLVANAVHHGTGSVTLSARRTRDGVAFEVEDEGPGFTGDPEQAIVRRAEGVARHGIGLALARSLAEAEGGRLVVTRSGPHPIVSLLFAA